MERKKKHTPGDRMDGQTSPQNSIEGEYAANAQVSLERIDELQKTLEDANLKSSEYFDGWQRERADFSNYKKRVEREQASLVQSLTCDILKKYLVIIDDLERALKVRPSSDEGAVWSEGIELIFRKMQGILETDAITRMDCTGQQFDPNYHEAVSYEDSPNHESNQIIEELQPGYLIGERILRPAVVRVAR